MIMETAMARGARGAARLSKSARGTAEALNLARLTQVARGRAPVR